MCGIVGYIGRRDAAKVVLAGLYRLEYRGYDSAGLAVAIDGEIESVRSQGTVESLEAKLADHHMSKSLSIGHTRWATHGPPSEKNSHPHTSHNGEVILVHNGIIENYEELKMTLISNGYKFSSDTDTEVLASWIEYVKRKLDCSLADAVKEALKEVVGAYAICVIEPGSDEIIVAKKSSPIAIGIGEYREEKEFIIASDGTPIVPYTDELIYLEDDQVAIINREEIVVQDFDSVEIEPEVKKVKLDISKIEMDGWESFMMKEINEQPETVMNCLRGRLTPGEEDIMLGGIHDHMHSLMRANKIFIIACGTSWHSALIGKWMIETLARIPVEVDYASEFRYRSPIVGQGDVVIGITQSGETADTKAALEEAKKKGAIILGIVNVVGSSIARLAHSGIYTHSGIEIGVASTKAFTGQVAALSLLAIKLGRQLGHIGDEKYVRLKDALREIPKQIDEVLSDTLLIEGVADIFTHYDDFLYLGRGISFPVALEGALKLKEISYVHAEAYPAGEMKHGPIALIDAHCPSIFILPSDSSYKKVVSNMQEIKARSGKTIVITNEATDEINALADAVIVVPKTEPELSPLLTTIPLQIFSHKVASNRKLNVDKPRNLAKSVTVE